MVPHVCVYTHIHTFMYTLKLSTFHIGYFERHTLTSVVITSFEVVVCRVHVTDTIKAQLWWRSCPPCTTTPAPCCNAPAASSPKVLVPLERENHLHSMMQRRVKFLAASCWHRKTTQTDSPVPSSWSRPIFHKT